jgi:hypothetical protein
VATATSETTSAPTSAPPKRDFRQEVTDRIITMLRRCPLAKAVESG